MEELEIELGKTILLAEGMLEVGSDCADSARLRRRAELTTMKVSRSLSRKYLPTHDTLRKRRVPGYMDVGRGNDDGGAHDISRA